MPSVELANEDVHRALAYLVATAARLGRPLPTTSFDAYAAAPDPKQARYRTVGGFASSTLTSWNAMMNALAGTAEKIGDGEKMSEYLFRVGWAERNDDGITPTPLGAAVLQALNAPVVDVSSEDPVTVVIDPDDPLAYARVFGLIVSQDEGLVVDPYLDHKEFFELFEIASVTRILTSDRGLNSKRPIIEKALASLDGRVQVRTLSEKMLHDRFFIPNIGNVLVFGSSLNSLTRRPGVVTPLADITASGAIREAYEKLWASASAISA